MLRTVSCAFFFNRGTKGKATIVLRIVGNLVKGTTSKNGSTLVDLIVHNDVFNHFIEKSSSAANHPTPWTWPEPEKIGWLWSCGMFCQSATSSWDSFSKNNSSISPSGRFTISFSESTTALSLSLLPLLDAGEMAARFMDSSNEVVEEELSPLSSWDNSNKSSIEF